MTTRKVWRGMASPPLIVQLFGLLVGALISAQLVALFLTLVLPPSPPHQYALEDIAAALRGRTSSSTFDVATQAGPPDLSGRGWFVSATSRKRLAQMLETPESNVVLGFYTQLPVVGSVEPARAPAQLPDDATRDNQAISAVQDEVQLRPATLVRFLDQPFTETLGTDAGYVQDVPGAPPGGGFPGGGPPGAGGPGPGMPGGGFPQSMPPQGPPPSARMPPQQPPPSQLAPSQAPQSAQRPDSGGQPPTQQNPGAQPRQGFAPQPAPGIGPANPPAQPPLMQSGQFFPPAQLPPATSRPADRIVPSPSPSPSLSAPETPRTPGISGQPLQPGDSATAAVPATAQLPGAPSAAQPQSGDAKVAGTAKPVIPRRIAPGLFGITSSPFVEGDFIAAVRMPDGQWSVVMPRAEGFPNAWQRRVALWFLLSLLAVAPITLIFVRRIVGPLADFARAAELLGRDPGAAVLPLEGPAEVGRAAHAFNQMQSRLRAFVDDRTAMIGAISHDLRTPLTRLRFRIEDVPDDQRDGLLEEVLEMEEMITSVISFMRDANTPNVRERRDLAELLDDVVENAVLVGGDIRKVETATAMVDIDALGVRRILDNLLVNAIKYGGGSTWVKLHLEESCAVADIVDDGPGIPEAELERVFDPFYRSESAVQSGREGSGLGLAVCRSIARAHGGDVELFRSAEGFTARVTLPLAYDWEREAA